MTIVETRLAKSSLLNHAWVLVGVASAVPVHKPGGHGLQPCRTLTLRCLRHERKSFPPAFLDNLRLFMGPAIGVPRPKVNLSSHSAITTGESFTGFFSFTTLGLARQMHYHQQTKWRATGRS